MRAAYSRHLIFYASPVLSNKSVHLSQIPKVQFVQKCPATVMCKEVRIGKANCPDACQQ